VALIVAVAVVAILLIMYISAKNPRWATKGFWMVHLVESPESVYKRSGGTFDDAAQLALRRTVERDNLRPEDHMLAATIITRNIIAQEHRVGEEMTTADAEQARLRQEVFDQAREHYMAALDGLRAQVLERPPDRAAVRTPARATTPPGNRPEAPDRAAIRPAARYTARPTARPTARTTTRPATRPRTAQMPRAPQMPPLGAGFMIDAALDFAVGGMATLLTNDPVLRAIVGAEDIQIMLLDAPLAQAAQRTREEVIARRRAVAQAGPTPAARSHAYVDMAVAHTNDPQTAHDTAVNGCLRAVVKRLRNEQGAELPSLDSIVRDINADGARLSDGRKAIVDDALAVVKRAREGEKNIAVGITDEEALRRVWLRADHPRNKEVRQRIRQAVFDNLAACWENGINGRKIVCVNGRTSKILSSLVLLDFDEQNWSISTVEQLKNDIFGKAIEVMDGEARAAVASKDRELQKVGRAQLAKIPEELAAIGPLDATANNAFVATTKDAIARMVDAEVSRINEATDGAISAPMADGIKKEAMAAVIASPKPPPKALPALDT
jgi:hypothetical protein